MPSTAIDVKHIRVPFEVKEFDDAARTFRGFAATWDLDLGGDVIVKGAFKRTIQAWKKAKSRKHNLLDSHTYGTIFSVLGDLLEAEETDEGVDCLWRTLDIPSGQHAHALVKAGNVHSLSIGYETVTQRAATLEEQKRGIWRYILELKWLETSLVLFPMNPAAVVDLQTVKGMLSRTDLSDVDRAVLLELKSQLCALFPEGDTSGTPPVAPEVGLAPEARIKLDDTVRALNLRYLGVK